MAEQSEMIARQRQEIAALRKDAAAKLDLLTALERIAAGQEMTDAYGLADVITRYQRIAMDAIAKATNANSRR